MADLIEVKVPDIGDFKDVPIIDVLVHPGDRVKAEDPLITLESDKASMDVPSPVDGVVKEIKVKAGERIKVGQTIFVVEEGQSGKEQRAESSDRDHAVAINFVVAKPVSWTRRAKIIPGLWRFRRCSG